MTVNPLGPYRPYYDYAWCPVCQRAITNPHYCPGPPVPKTWTGISTIQTPKVGPPFDADKELPGTVILLDDVYYIKGYGDEEYIWASSKGEFVNATIMNARYKSFKSFRFLKRPRTSKRAVLERLIDHRDIDKALDELKDASD